MTVDTSAPLPAPHRVLIAQKYASLGGSQVSLVHHLALLDRRRFEPFVVVSNEGWLTARLDELGVSWSIANFGHWTNLLSLPANARLIWQVRRLIRERGIELVHANEHWVAPPLYCAARLSGIPSICHFRTGLEDLTPSRVRKYLYGRFDRVIVVADVLRKALARHVGDPSRIVVIRDGVEPSTEVPRYRRRSRRRLVINVGALYEVKGQAKILLRVLPWLKANRFHYLVFVGGTRTAPSYVEGMKRLVDEHGLRRQVRFLGSREDVPRLLGLADALVAYSTVEGIPRVVMEAMFAGRPVIVSNTPGMEEVVTDGEVGRVVDFEGQNNALVRALEDLTDNTPRWQEMGRQARTRAMNLYSTKATSEAIQAIYTELLELSVNARAHEGLA
jgi:glycosyltransferase involved in cell wall biosynthesis